MTPPPSDPKDPYSRVNYRRLIAWSGRIEREWPFLDKVLSRGPSRRVLDLGCGTGEHSRFLAEKGYEVVGVDLSESMLRTAREEVAKGVSFVHGDLRELEAIVDGSFGGAICLGNTLPHLREEGDLRLMARELRRCLQPGAPAVFQILNYDRILDQRVRSLPVNVRPPEEGEEGEIVFLRLMDPRPDGTVVFVPSTLVYQPGADPPLRTLTSREVRLRGWRHAEMEEALAAAPFDHRQVYGAFDEQPFNREQSHDLIVVAR